MENTIQNTSAITKTDSVPVTFTFTRQHFLAIGQVKRTVTDYAKQFDSAKECLVEVERQFFDAFPELKRFNKSARAIERGVKESRTLELVNVNESLAVDAWASIRVNVTRTHKRKKQDVKQESTQKSAAIQTNEAQAQAAQDSAEQALQRAVQAAHDKGVSVNEVFNIVQSIYS